MIFITEDISFPIDEGIKKYSFKLAKYLENKNQASIFTHVFNKDITNQHELPKNKLFLAIHFFAFLRKKEGDIIYAPNASSTFASFLRLKLLKIISSKSTVLIGIQKRKHSTWQKLLIKSFLRPNLMFVFSQREKEYFQSLGIRSKITSIGVNTDKYTPVVSSQKLTIRKKLNLPINKKIVLHVGHINDGRNLTVLKGLVSKGYYVIVIGSTCFIDDKTLKLNLIQEGIHILSEYIENINEYYQAVDAYVFPVIRDDSVIEFPLSVLEAMACNLPILSTPFGSLPNHFKETKFFKYFTDTDSLVRQTADIFANNDLLENENAAIVLKHFTWEEQFKKLTDKINTL